MRPEKHPYPLCETSAEWLAAFCFNWLHKYEKNGTPGGVIGFFLRHEPGHYDIAEEDVRELQTYEAILERIETDLAILNVQHA